MEYEWTLEIKYSPDQPRVPAGQSGGGRWTSYGTGHGPTTPQFSEADPKDFRAALDKAIKPRYAAFVTKYSPQEYQEMGAKTYLIDDGKTGFALKPDGDIISVFSAGGKGRAALQAAIEFGGKKLDCFDGFLPNLYQRFGFKEYERWTWDDQYAPENWDPKDNSPDVVLMRRGE